jgi:hypothetical protein
VLEGKNAVVPISLSGRAPFVVEYQKNESEIIRKIINGHDKNLVIQGVGKFELKSLKDSVCYGYVEKKNQITVLTIAKPSASIKNTNPDESVCCAGDDESFIIDLEGKAPYTITYEHIIEKASTIEKQTNTVTVDTDFLKVLFNTDKPGKHSYTINSIADDNYKHPIPVTLQNHIAKTINEIPNAEFIDTEERVFQCTSTKNDHHSLLMKLYGIPPFEITLEQKHDNQFIDTLKKNATLSSLVKMDDYYQFDFRVNGIDLMGKHEFFIQKVVDASGCTFSMDKTLQESKSTFIKIADQARINTFNKDIVCVGDLLSYSLQGTPPFTVGYTMSGKAQKDVVVEDPIFSIWAGVEGELQIQKVCNAAGCCDETLGEDMNLKTIIKNIPTAIVGDGTDQIEDIRQGDESRFTVDFVGEPPFSFTYTRIIKNGRNDQEDVFTVNDIEQKRVIFLYNLVGIIDFSGRYF